MPEDKKPQRKMTEVTLDSHTRPDYEGDQNLLDQILHADQDIITPFQACKLPSLGLYYNWNGIDSCEVRAMNKQVEMMLTKPGMAQDGSAVDKMLEYCCRFPDNMSPLDLLVGDRNYLMYVIRGITHGNMYKFTTTCPNAECGEAGIYEFDLNGLSESIVYASPEIKEPYRLVLPHFTQTFGKEVYVGMRFLRGSDLYKSLHDYKMNKAMLTGGVGGARVRASRAKSSSGPKENVYSKLVEDMTLDCIDNVCGEHDRTKIKMFMERAHSADLEVIRAWLDKYMPSVDMTVTVTCNKCSSDFSIELPMSDYFFRPKKTERVG